MTTASTPVDNGRKLQNMPDVLQFMQLLWAFVHGLERTSKWMTGEIGVTGPNGWCSVSSVSFPGSQSNSN